jgi:hypothetical protein
MKGRNGAPGFDPTPGRLPLHKAEMVQVLHGQIQGVCAVRKSMIDNIRVSSMDQFTWPHPRTSSTAVAWAMEIGQKLWP